MERDQNRIHELVSDMENLIRTNDELRRDHQTLSQKELLMTNKIMSRNKVFVTAQGLSEHVTADSLNFNLSDDDWAEDMIRWSESSPDKTSPRAASPLDLSALCCSLRRVASRCRPRPQRWHILSRRVLQAIDFAKSSPRRRLPVRTESRCSLRV